MINRIRVYLLLFLLSFTLADIDWSLVDDLLDAAISNGSFPGCTALVASNKGILYKTALGNYTYGEPSPLNNGENPAVDIETLYDMASCSKVTGATTAIAQFYQRGQLDLNTPIMNILGKDFAQNGKEDITVLNCLLHNAGFPPDPSPLYYSEAFGCPQTSEYHPEMEFSCQSLVWDSLMSQTLENPIGTTYVYSDLSFITLMFVIGTLAQELNYVQQSDLVQSCVIDPSSPAIAQCYFEAYLRLYIFPGLGMFETGFLPDQTLWSQCAPTENDTSYLHRVIQGQVSDGNAYAMGGVAGHAGIFSNIGDMYLLMSRVLFASDDDPIINATTAAFFTKEYNHSQSSRALGWNTNDPTVFDEGWGLLCGNMSAKTFMHVGFTGTEVCGDPERGLITILLTNRVYPSAEDYKIEDTRRAFNSLVVALFDNSMEDNSMEELI